MSNTNNAFVNRCAWEKREEYVAALQEYNTSMPPDVALLDGEDILSTGGGVAMLAVAAPLKAWAARNLV